MMPTIIIFCAFTRRWALDRWIEDLRSLNYPPNLINLCIIVDFDGKYIIEVFQELVKNNGYRSFHYRLNDMWLPNEHRIAARRQRIAEVKNQSKDLIAKCDGDIVVSFEDDTVFTNLDLTRLIQPIRDNDTVGFVEGVQCGRWSIKLIGAWKVDEVKFPAYAHTLLPGVEEYEQIDAGGFYGYATRKDLYLQHDYYSSTNQPFGPDVNFGLYVRQRGYDCFIDWETIFGHNDYDKILYPVDDPTARGGKGMLESVSFTKSPEDGRWRENPRQRK